MMSVENYQDRTLTCRDCGQDFTFTVGEQELPLPLANKSFMPAED